MDVRVKHGIRSWALGTATLSLLSPGLLLAQTASKPSVRNVTAPPAQLQPAEETIRLAAQVTDQNVPQLAESEVEARLRELYERDGREMPNITLAPSSAAAPGQTSIRQAAPGAQPRYSTAPSVAPAPKSDNKVTGFFKKLVPGGNRKSAATQPPRQLQPAYTSPPAVSNLPPVAQPRNVVQPQPIATPQYQQPSQTASSYGQTFGNATSSIPAVAQPTRVQATSTQSVHSVTAARPANVPATRPAQAGLVGQAPSPRIVPRGEEFQPPAGRLPQTTELQFGAPEISLDDEAMDEDSMDLDDLELDPTPQDTSAPNATPARGFDEEFPDPFAGTAVEESSSEPIENPYTGQTLEPLDTPPARLAPVIAPQARVDRTATDETTATKMRRIIQRTDMKGLKGFCPVTLRDQRELADSRPEHVATYRGQKFYCASQVAQAKFEADPARYAPAAYGADVVVLTDDQDVAEGSLDYAAWYKGRLYLFSGQETHDTFVANPERYASPPGIE